MINIFDLFLLFSFERPLFLVIKLLNVVNFVSFVSIFQSYKTYPYVETYPKPFKLWRHKCRKLHHLLIFAFFGHGKCLNMLQKLHFAFCYVLTVEIQWTNGLKSYVF